MLSPRLLFVCIFLVFLSASASVVAQPGWTAMVTGTTKDLDGVFSATALQTIAVGGSGTIVGSTNGGVNWISANSGTTQRLRKVIVAGFTTPVIWIVGDAGTLLRSTSSGFTWGPVASGVTADLHDIFAIDYANGTTICIVGKNGTILKTTTSGVAWVPQPAPVTTHLNGVFFSDPLIGYAVGDAGTIITTTNGGTTWLSLNSGVTADLNHLFFTSLQVGWIVGDGGTLLSTTDAGQSWSSVVTGVSHDLRRLFFSDAQNGTAVGRGGTILRTTNAGGNWVQQTSGTTADLNSVFFTDLLTGIVVGNGGLAKKTINGGVPVELEHFSAQTLADGVVRLDWITATEVQNFGFSVERSEGASWEAVGFVNGNGDSQERHSYSFTDRPRLSGQELQYRLRQIDYDGGEQVSPVLNVSLATPSECTVAVAPNPCSGNALVYANLDADADVRLAVYDAGGREHAVLYEGPANAGAHMWRWLAGNAAPGAYYAVLRSGTLVLNATIILQ